MELVKNILKPIVPRKRSLDDSNDRDNEALRKLFPTGCGIKEDRKSLNKTRKVYLDLENDELNSLKPNNFAEKPKVITTVVTERKPLKVLATTDTLTEHGELRRNKPSFGSKPAGKVKFWDPTCTKEGLDQQPKVTTSIVSRGKPKEFGTTATGSRKEHAKREKIKEAMSVFDEVYRQLLEGNRLKEKGEKIANWRVPVEAAKIAKQLLKWMDPEKSLGPICGVQIGDKFKYRSQLKMIGLHCQLQSGIDYTNIEGKNLAISIVDSHRYSNESASSDMLVYSGHGGLKFLGPKLPPEDQKLERGNLELKNSMDERTPIRVIRKVEGFEKNGLFVYDGLYVVNHCTQKRNEEGKIAFKFHLNRVPGQPALHQMLNASC